MVEGGLVKPFSASSTTFDHGTASACISVSLSLSAYHNDRRTNLIRNSTKHLPDQNPFPTIRMIRLFRQNARTTCQTQRWDLSNSSGRGPFMHDTP